MPYSEIIEHKYLLLDFSNFKMIVMRRNCTGGSVINSNYINLSNVTIAGMVLKYFYYQRYFPNIFFLINFHFKFDSCSRIQI